MKDRTIMNLVDTLQFIYMLKGKSVVMNYEEAKDYVAIKNGFDFVAKCQTKDGLIELASLIIYQETADYYKTLANY